MTIKDLETLYDYGHWANKKLFNVISQLTPEQFTQPVGGSYGSIRNTMVHVLSAEWGWLDRCGGAERGSRLNPDDFPTVESLMEVWNKVEIYVREFLSKLKDDELARHCFPMARTTSGTGSCGARVRRSPTGRSGCSGRMPLRSGTAG